VLDAAVHDEVDFTAAATQVAQHETESKPAGQPAPRLPDGCRTEAVRDLVAREQQAGDGRERHDALRVTGRLVNEVGGEPVAPEGQRRDRDHLPGRQQQPNRPPGPGRLELVDGHDAVAQRHAREAQPLLLGSQVDLLGVELLFELPFQIVEEVIPAHS
jgi:hypothetical protein